MFRSVSEGVPHSEGCRRRLRRSPSVYRLWIGEFSLPMDAVMAVKNMEVVILANIAIVIRADIAIIIRADIAIIIREAMAMGIAIRTAIHADIRTAMDHLKSMGKVCPALFAWGYKGCYVDNRNRVFPHSPTTSNSMTTALCKAHCKRNGYAYAGTEFGKQCFCGTAADFAKCKTRPAKNCYKRCPGNGKEICGGVWRISVYEISGGGGGGGGGGDTKYTTHYRVYNEAKTYSEAQKRCQQDGGHLADLKTPAIVAVVNKLVDSRRDYWIGLNDIGREGGWHWSDGVPLSSCSYKNWYPGEPNNIGNEDCGHLWGGSKRLKWNDMSCSAPKYFICQTGARQLSGCTGSPDGGGGGPHPGYKEYRGSYYRAFSGQFKTYYEAQQECKKDGGHLADLKTKGLADFVTGLVEKRYNYWIGLNDIWVEGRWSWSDGVELSTCGYKNWAPGQPPRSASMFDDCGHLKADQGQKWNDLGCYQKMFYICQIGRGEASGCTGQAVDLRPEYKGCYRDASRRKFPTRYMTSNQQTTSLCVNFCRQYKFPYAATEYGNQCYCGREQDFSAIGSSLPNAQCNTPCTGNPYQKCGGNWKMSVYKTATGPAPVNSLCLGKLTCPAQKPGTCLAWGDPHYITFDNRRHDFQGTCKYTLVRHADFTVAVRNVHRAGKSKRVAFCDRVEVTVYGYKIQIRSGRGRDVLVNGYRRSLPVCLNRKVAISISGLNVQIQTDHCFSLTYDGNHRVQIKVPDSYKGKLSGMCGNYNGRPNDDNLMPGGQVASTSLLYGNSWIAPDDDTCPDTRPQDNFDSNDISPSDRRKYLHPTKCGLLKAASGPFRSCNAILVPAEFVETCVFDMAAYQGDVAVLCQNLQAYADACVSSGGKPGQWRRSGFCAVQCPPHSRYSQCASPCPRTCADSAPRPCTKNCVESCVCDNGYVLSGANCVPLSSCGCSKDGNLYEKNEVWKSGNEICKCLPNRRIQCERQTGGEVSVEIGGTSWNTIGGSLSFVSIGFCGVWGVNTAGEVLYRAGTYGNERAPGTAWLKVSGSVTLVQISSGKGIVWGITARYRVYVRIGITAQRPQGTGWTEIRGRPLKSVCVSEYYVWGVTTTGSVYYRTGVTAGRQMGTGWALLRGPVIRGLSYVSIGYSGVWGVTSSGAIWYRSGTYGGKGSAGTRWVQVTGSLVSISVGYNVVWGVSAIGQVFIRIGITAQTPVGTAWRLVGGSLTQIYVSSSSNHVWGCGLSYHIYLRVGITWTSGPVDVPEPTCHAKADIHVLVDGSKSVKTRNFPSVRQFILKLAAGFEIGPNKARIGVYQFAKDMRTEFKMNQYNNRGALLNAIKKIEYMNKLQTKTGASLKAVYNEFTKANGARDDVEKVIILVTDGKATDQVREPAQYVKNKGAHVFTVGVAKYKIDELKLIASNDDYVATADDFDDLDRIRDKVLEVVCNADKGKRNIGAEVENGLQYLKRTAGELMDDLEGRENLGLETLQTETGEEAAMQLREMLDSMSELTTNAIDAGEEVTKEVSLVLNEIDQQLQDIRDLSDIRDPSNIRDLPEPDGFEESRDFHEPEELEEIQDFPEPEGLEEIRNLLELDGLEEIRNLPEPGGLEEIQEFPEPGGLEDIQEFPEPEGLEEIHEFPEPEGLEEIQADELEEIQNLPETGGLEEIQEFPEPGGLEEIQEFPEPEGLEEIQADELEEIRNLPEPGGLEEVLNELEELIGG
ncbi:FCGBP [Branchiostoma lanceolatum]|uniref:FCGBP protein n=1 Tax=Branchiostoma lanceolatum TaxID=7740 RepID=A0A8K0AE28_BRALA|nr:FCGBP [Branchiostoma lanceolatum]